MICSLFSYKNFELENYFKACYSKKSKKIIFPTTDLSLTQSLTLQMNSLRRTRDKEGLGCNSVEGDDTNQIWL